VGSAIANHCSRDIGTLYLHAGPEIAVASTKAFIAQVVALKLFALAVAKARGLLQRAQEEAMVDALSSLPERIVELLKLDQQISDVAKDLKAAPRMLYLGRGELFPVALEGALKMKELSYIFAEGYPAGELKHGPIATIDQGMPAVVLFGHGVLAVKTASNLQEIKARGAKVISLVPGFMEEVEEASDVVFDIKACEPWLVPVLATIPLQLLAYHLSVHKGLDPDKPRNLAKSVTVE
ncbi:MAG TPA: SIS domain-containing protein, partial [Myxococcota bacterium]|nr:SIS domain-containing protein [Myxococcota bacterium]